MAAAREIKDKIGSIQNTQKITSAMEMVAASKMRKTQDRMREGRPYATRIRAVIGHLANAAPEYRHTFMEEREVKKVGYIVISTDKGLCGGLNVNLFRMLVNDMSEWKSKGINSQFGLVGNKAISFFNSFGGEVSATANNLGEAPSVSDLIGSIKVMIDAYEQGEIDRLYIACNNFESAMTQTPEINQLLPLLADEDEEIKHRWDYLYEPDAKELIEGLIQRYIESQVYQAVVENSACEQAAKMMAMKNATDNAGSLIDDLTLLYNNVRQAAITQEIAEIVGGAAAV
ncbi:MAG: F0F1 ATP synthase subunit gamma [Pseudomonadales bacterium]|nr:F0F1 ATP synthase subunit gamma [Pseudomonadales bacterium]